MANHIWSVSVAREALKTGAYDHLRLAINWAQQLKLKVMLDLHGAPGSQNSFDNSCGNLGKELTFGVCEAPRNGLETPRISIER